MVILFNHTRLSQRHMGRHTRHGLTCQSSIIFIFNHERLSKTYHLCHLCISAWHFTPPNSRPPGKYRNSWVMGLGLRAPFDKSHKAIFSFAIVSCTLSHPSKHAIGILTPFPSRVTTLVVILKRFSGGKWLPMAVLHSLPTRPPQGLPQKLARHPRRSRPCWTASGAMPVCTSGDEPPSSRFGPKALKLKAIELFEPPTCRYMAERIKLK